MDNSVIRDFWNDAACGETAYAVGTEATERFSSQGETRYELEPFIKRFARFEEGHQRAVLEIGVGMGADHEQWARNRPARLCGIDLTPRAVDLTRERLALAGLQSDVQVGDVLVTSGIDGVYPSGLPVAKVVDIERNATMAFARITCEPLSGVDRRNHVLVLNPMRELPERPAEKPEPALKQKKPKRGAP